MNIIAEKRWSHVLFDDGKGWVLTFLVGGVVEVDISIRLTSQEIEKIKNDLAYIDAIIDEVKKNQEDFSSREIIPPVWPPN